MLYHYQLENIVAERYNFTYKKHMDTRGSYLFLLFEPI